MYAVDSRTADRYRAGLVVFVRALANAIILLGACLFATSWLAVALVLVAVWTLDRFGEFLRCERGLMSDSSIREPRFRNTGARERLCPQGAKDVNVSELPDFRAVGAPEAVPPEAA